MGPVFGANKRCPFNLVPVLRLGEYELVEVVLEVVGHPRPAVAVVDSEESQIRIRLQVGEGCAPVL